ncbi:alpha/beta fold hydrolase [Aquidulcibacter sp.]|uniref:alpha/beta fold hydrolase n=1 Tax=Aquidulcibacter sp. TaxID=2052990 RepID=UPI003953D691
MPTIQANGIELYYEERGEASGVPLLLVMGLGRQLIAWPEDFMAQLVAAGHRVILFDNRDVGLSTHFHGVQVASPVRAIAGLLFGIGFKTAYQVKDMAADAVALLDHLGIEAAHIVGVSMGGMIAQSMAIHHPSRLRSLISVMSTSGARGLPGAPAKLRQRLTARRSTAPSRAEAIEIGRRTLELISYPDPARAPDAFINHSAAAYDRAYDPKGTLRQLIAILADGARAGQLAKVTAPTLVIHGKQDELVPLACGVDTARRIQGAKLEVIDQMAHDLPPSKTKQMADLIITHTQSVEQGRAAAA